MGVAGLWEVLRPAGQVRSLTELAVENGFNANPNHQRGFRIGIDASIWFFHAAYGREGENPELRTLFFRCSRLLQLPLLPLFVFDGPNRPAIKRGKRVGGNAHWLTQGMKNIIDAFGFEWWVAPGEAEAELAYLNRVGIIDAVLSDDVDNFLFGAIMVIRNPSNTLSGNRAHPVKNAQGRDDGNHVVTYRADVILSDPSVALSRAGTILIGLLSGGDYIPAGLPGCGQKFSTGLARAGFGDSLLKAVKELKGARLDAFLDQWRQDVRNELKTNKSGLLPSKKPSLAASLPDDFPSLPVLMSYADPLTSENTPSKGRRKGPRAAWRNDPDPMKIASLCELYFEWGVKDVIVQRFRTVLWPGIVCRAVRRAVMNKDTRRRPTLKEARLSDEEEYDTDEPPSPTKRISSSLSSLALSSPSKNAPSLESSVSESFMLSSLVPLTSSSTTSTASPLLMEVLSQRTHASTDYTLEYRVVIDPTKLVKRTESGVKGLRPPLVGGLFGIDSECDSGDEDGTADQDADESGSDDAVERLETAAGAASKSGTKKRKARREVPTTPLRLWLPACMVRAAAPALVEVYEEKVKAREAKKAKRGTKGSRGGCTGAKPGTKAKDVVADDDEETMSGPSIPKKGTGSKTRPYATRIGSGRGRRKSKQASEAQDDAYEFIDLSAEEIPCPSDGEGAEERAKSKGKAKMKAKAKAKQIVVVKPTATKANAKTHTTNDHATTNTMKEFFNAKKPSTVGATKSKSSTCRRPVAKESELNVVVPKRVYEEGDSVEAAALPLLPKSLRPLDFRAKTKTVVAVPDPASKSSTSATILRCEEESSSSASSSRLSRFKHNASTQSAHLGRKKPVFIEVSDSDHEIVANNVRNLLSGCAAATMATRHAAGIKTGVRGSNSSTNLELLSTPPVAEARRVGDVIDLTAKGCVSMSQSTSSAPIHTASIPVVHPASAPVGAGTNARTDPGLNAGSLPTSKLSHIFLRRPVLESKEEEKSSEDDKLPTFHHGSAKSRGMAGATNPRPTPRPFPIQFATEPSVSPSTLGFKGKKGGTYADENNGDEVEIVDLFTTPCGPSPPRSPTPTPSPIKPLLVHTSVGPATFEKPSEFPTSPTQPRAGAERQKAAKQRHHESFDTPVSGNERNEILKSPRKSVAHASPRHVAPARGRASSPTPLMSCNSLPRANNAVLDAEEYDASDDLHTVGRKPRLSDASAIYISSESEDEDSAGLGIENIQESEANEEQDRGTDRDVDEWADTGMILSAPPSPACAPLSVASDFVAVVSAVDADPDPPRVSKFKPAVAGGSKLDTRVVSPVETMLVGSKVAGDAYVPRPVCHHPLLVARARQSQCEDDVIDLTSD